jgi:Protein of unknown function (DUF3102)
MDTFDYSLLTSVDIHHLRQASNRARSLLAAVTPGAIEIGDIIIDAKDKIPHGQFGAWCSEALGIDRRRAQIYTNLAKLAKTHGRELVEKLPLVAAHHVAARSTPEKVVAEVMDRVAAGNIPTATVVKGLIRETRKIETPRADDLGPEDEIEVLSGFLLDALDGLCLSRLAKFFSAASPQAVRELGRSLEASMPDRSGCQERRDKLLGVGVIA